MQPRDEQRLEHILDYCEDIKRRLLVSGMTSTPSVRTKLIMI